MLKDSTRQPIFDEVRIIQVHEVSAAPFVHLQQLYEHEFSPITANKTNDHGLYDPKASIQHWSSTFDLYLLYRQTRPIGLAVINLQSMIDHNTDTRDVAEFFIMPDARGHGLGQWFAHELFKKYPGRWQVRQLPGLAVKEFWCKVIPAFSKNGYKDIDLRCPAWEGSIQEFESEIDQ